MRVLVTGGAGFIGAHTVVKLLNGGNRVAVVDNFTNSSPAVLDRVEQITGIRPVLFEIDLTDAEATRHALEQARPDAVIHFAGLKAVGESVSQPLAYYKNNLVSTLNLLESMREQEVYSLVFSSSATVYGDRLEPPFREDADHLESTNPYGQSKVMIERILTDLASSDSRWRIALLRYFNPIGAHASGLIGEDPRGIPNNIAPYIAQVAVGRLPSLSVFGNDYPTTDGTGERDYIHVEDLAEGHIAALTALSRVTGAHAWNLGTGKPTSVLELVEAFEVASGRDIPFEITDRRPGDIAQAWADPSRAAEELNWTATRTVDEMARDAWRWQSTNPSGYA